MSTTVRLWDGRDVPRVGIGCWAIGGPFKLDGRNDGWGDIDDATSLKALALAHELGARVFENLSALDKGPLSAAAMAEIDALLSRELA